MGNDTEMAQRLRECPALNASATIRRTERLAANGEMKDRAPVGGEEKHNSDANSLQLRLTFWVPVRVGPVLLDIFFSSAEQDNLLPLLLEQ